KTPSFNVSPEKQIFHCFGCGVGGNVFKFVMDYEKISFIDVLKRFSEETGIELEIKEKSPELESENELLYEANEIALTFFQRQLSQSESTLQYLQKRGINDEMIKKLKLGYAPDSWDALVKHIEHFKYDIKVFEKSGLILKGEKKPGYYDRFRSRLMFPVLNISGKIAGFGGRDLSGAENTPKYINSPESPVYQKSREFYGLYFAKDAIRKSGKVIFVEGYMDWIQLFQHGIENVVATSGTSLTEDHSRIIRRYCPEVCVCYDADSAGVSAAIRGGEILFQNNLEVKVLLLPQGQDPDSFVNQKGAQPFLEMVESAEDYITFRLSQLKQKYDLQKALERSQAVREIIDTLAPLRDTIKSGFYVEKIADSLGIPNTLLYNELKKKVRLLLRRKSSGIGETQTNIQQTPVTWNGAWSAEKDLVILLMMYYDKIHEFIFKHIDEEDFLNEEFRQVFRVLAEHKSEISANLHQRVLDKIDNPVVQTMLSGDLFREFHRPDRYLQDCIRKMKIARFQSLVDEMGKKLRELDSSDPEYVLHL
ncbi:MAG: DNA primase, partial [Calditrichia bacterium]